MTQTYELYGSELSYFTRKLEAALIFYGIDYQSIDKVPTNGRELESRAGTHQIPVLRTPENWMIADTTPVMMMLDARRPHRRMFPEGPLGVLVHILEEFFDEWIARTMVHYRWHYPRSAEFAAPRIANHDPETTQKYLQWGPRVCRATGTESVHQQKAAEEEYRRLLGAMEEQLGQTRYLLGDRPTAVDCIVLGGLWAHTNMDPDPRDVVANFPRVVAWCESKAREWDGDGALVAFPASTPFARAVLAEMGSTYQPFILGNQNAQEEGNKAFVADIYGESVSYLSRAYPEQSRQMIRDRIAHQLSPEAQSEVADWLVAVGLSDSFGKTPSVPTQRGGRPSDRDPIG
ncbi:MAG: glutathione S-transferase family protein [Myxococcota bacterium]